MTEQQSAQITREDVANACYWLGVHEAAIEPLLDGRLAYYKFHFPENPELARATGDRLIAAGYGATVLRGIKAFVSGQEPAIYEQELKRKHNVITFPARLPENT